MLCLKSIVCIQYMDRIELQNSRVMLTGNSVICQALLDACDVSALNPLLMSILPGRRKPCHNHGIKV